VDLDKVSSPLDDSAAQSLARQASKEAGFITFPVKGENNTVLEMPAFANRIQALIMTRSSLRETLLVASRAETPKEPVLPLSGAIAGHGVYHQQSPNDNRILNVP